MWGKVTTKRWTRKAIVANPKLWGQRAARFLSVPLLQVTPLRESRRYGLSELLSKKGLPKILEIVGEKEIDRLASAKAILPKSSDFDKLADAFPLSYVRPVFEVLDNLGITEQTIGIHTVRVLRFFEVLENADDSLQLSLYLLRKGDPFYVSLAEGLAPARERIIELSKMYQSLKNKKVLLIAALIHDYGKTIDGPNHLEEGYNLVLKNRSLRCAVKYALGKEYRYDKLLEVAHLVRLHANFSDTEGKERGMFDLIWQCLNVPVQNRENFIEMMFLLAVADKNAFGERGYLTPDNLEELFELLEVVQKAVKSISSPPSSRKELIINLGRPPFELSAVEYGKKRFLAIIGTTLGAIDPMVEAERLLEGRMRVAEFLYEVADASRFFYLPTFLRKFVDDPVLKVKFVVWAILTARKHGLSNIFFLFDRNDPERKQIGRIIEAFRRSDLEEISKYYSFEEKLFEGERILYCLFNDSL
ncbi:MAG: HD domain-containing protein [Candidatus Saganbacteria bacterium]|nr:HD domain-containing protein [Candidatus Saganbacteria bacterium]